MDRKPKFRSRKLEFNKQLAVYRFDEIDEFEDFDSPLRSVVPVATGVDKEEEEEHHLRQALSHQGNKTQTYYIPTPETAENALDFDVLYPKTFKISKTYFKPATNTDELLFAFPKYNFDTLDEDYIKGLREAGDVNASFTMTTFENIIDCFEDAAHKFSESIVTSESIERLKDADATAIPPEPVVNKIIDYWKEKRNKRPSLIPFLRHEDIGKIGADPYVCFRRRELKVPRKTRRTDAQIQDRIRKLYFDISSIKLALEAGIKRDRFKKEALELECELFNKYQLVDSWRRHNKSEWPPHLPSFKAAAQSLLEQRKKRPRGNSMAEQEESSKQSSAIKIAIPTSVLKSSRFHKPYFPHDVDRQIQKDLDTIFGHVASIDAMEAKVADLTSPFDFTHIKAKAHPMVDGMRGSLGRGRGGRFVLRPSQRPIGTHRPICDLPEEYYARYPAALFVAKDFSQLQTPVGNYNVHAVQTANQILKPMSFQAWIAATAPILAAISGGNVDGNGKPKSPKRKRTRTQKESTAPTTSHPASSEVEGASTPSASPKKQRSPLKQAQSAPSSELSQLGGSSQITVNVKVMTTKTKDEISRKTTGARFTPHGLAPDHATSPSAAVNAGSGGSLRSIPASSLSSSEGDHK